jgi:hypothetical protein
MEEHNPLSREQIGAIKRSIKLGRTLQKDHPEIVTMWRDYPRSQILKILNIQIKYGVVESVALSGFYYAIAGHNGDFGIENYEGLILDKEERGP